MKYDTKILRNHSLRSFSSIFILSSSKQSPIITTEKPYTILRFKIFYSDELWLMYNNSFSPNNVKIQKHIIKVNVHILYFLDIFHILKPPQKVLRCWSGWYRKCRSQYVCTNVQTIFISNLKCLATLSSIFVMFFCHNLDLDITKTIFLMTHEMMHRVSYG